MQQNGSQNLKENIDLLEICLSFRDELRSLLKQAIEGCPPRSARQFLEHIMTGKCPLCGSRKTWSSQTLSYEFAGFCLRCGHVWCIECGRPLDHNSGCTHWDICRKCRLPDESGQCGVELSECGLLREGCCGDGPRTAS